MCVSEVEIWNSKGGKKNSDISDAALYRQKTEQVKI